MNIVDFLKDENPELLYELRKRFSKIEFKIIVTTMEEFVYEKVTQVNQNSKYKESMKGVTFSKGDRTYIIEGNGFDCINDEFCAVIHFCNADTGQKHIMSESEFFFKIDGIL